MCELNVPQFMQATATNVVAAERWYSGPPREEAVNSFRRALRRLILDLNGDGQRLWELFDRRHAGRLQRVEFFAVRGHELHSGWAAARLVGCELG